MRPFHEQCLNDTRTGKTLLLGPPGCGKTHTLIELVKKRIDQGVRPDEIGYVSFTRKAVEEARARCAVSLGLSKDDLPYFKTLHSLSYMLLGLDKSRIMSVDDWSEISRLMGVETFSEAEEDDESIVVPFTTSASKYLSIISRAKMRRVSLEQEFSETGDYKLMFPALLKMHNVLKDYMQQTRKFTFVSMLESVVEVPFPRLRLLIVDEAQDLVPLQWDIVQGMAEHADEVWFAGDDDQAIHRWAGVDVRRFINSTTNRLVLTQSHRLPRTVHRVSQNLVRRIPGRIQKEFQPKVEDGTVGQLLALSALDMSNGSWTLMTRTNAFAREWGDLLQSQGIYCTVHGKSPVPLVKLKGVELWEKLRAGQPLSPYEVRQLYEALPKTGDRKRLKRNASALLEALAPDSRVDHEALTKEFGLLAPLSIPPEEVVGLGEQQAIFVRSVKARKEPLSGDARIKVSTFHAMKGGEDDNVVVYLGTTRACLSSRFQDDEVRAFYVGLTRAKKNLYLVASGHKHRFVV
jgi:superfamily I DNA/RNA helicase